MEDVIMRLVCMAPLGISLVVLGLHVYFRVKNAPAHSAYLAQLRAGRLAERLGLAVVEGDPSDARRGLSRTDPPATGAAGGASGGGRAALGVVLQLSAHGPPRAERD